MCFLGHDEYEQKVDITTVWRVEIHWGIEVGKGSDGSFTFGEAAVRNGYAFPYGRAAEALSGHQGLEDRVGVECRIASRKAISEPLQRALLARCNEVRHGAFGSEEPIEVHGRSTCASRDAHGTAGWVTGASEKARFRTGRRSPAARPPGPPGHCLATERWARSMFFSLCLRICRSSLSTRASIAA